MKYILFILAAILFLSSVSHAGWCAKLFWVQDDPYQFEQVSTHVVLLLWERYEIQSSGLRAGDVEFDFRRALRRELDRRLKTQHPDAQQILTAFEFNEKFKEKIQ